MLPAMMRTVSATAANDWVMYAWLDSAIGTPGSPVAVTVRLVSDYYTSVPTAEAPTLRYRLTRLGKDGKEDPASAVEGSKRADFAPVVAGRWPRVWAYKVSNLYPELGVPPTPLGRPVERSVVTTEGEYVLRVRLVLKDDPAAGEGGAELETVHRKLHIQHSRLVNMPQAEK